MIEAGDSGDACMPYPWHVCTRPAMQELHMHHVEWVQSWAWKLAAWTQPCTMANSRPTNNSTVQSASSRLLQRVCAEDDSAQLPAEEHSLQSVTPGSYTCSPATWGSKTARASQPLGLPTDNRQQYMEEGCPQSPGTVGGWRSARERQK